MEGERAAMVLCNAGYYGTLAAVRSLGRAGVPVVTLDTGTFNIGRYSRHSSAYFRSPRFDSRHWPDWLLEFGRRGPRRAIYATSDAVSFALADRREELSSYFDLYQPDLDTMMSILDKGLLHKHAEAVGIDTPETWLPRSAIEAEKIVRDVGGPLVVKPRSQLSVTTGAKGLLIDASDGRDVYDDLLRQAGHDNYFIRRFPEVAMPMLQRYYPEAIDQVYSLSGFRDISGKHVVMRAALKILQNPRQLGIGVCFEEADVILELAERTLRLCERIGYYGAFELEFIASRDRMMLIDFNGRLYNQLAFDITRGMDLPKLVYAGATGRSEELSQLVQAEPRRQQGAVGLVFCNSFGLSLTVAAKRTFRTMSSEEANRWREWRRGAGEGLVDAVRDADDPLPALVDGAQQMWTSVRYARGFLKEMTYRRLPARVTA
jgi:D-aspartate ligase